MDDTTPGPRDGPPPRTALDQLLDLLAGLVADRLAGKAATVTVPPEEAGRAQPR